MKVSVIGKYGPFAPDGGACSCYLLEMGGKKIVLDLGSGSLSRLLARVGFDEIDAVMFSHLHSDHMTDIGIMGYAQDIWNKKHNSDIRLKVYLPKEPAVTLEHIMIGNKFEFLTVESGEFDVCGIKCTAYELAHPVLDHGYRFEADGEVFAFTGDTRMHDNLQMLLKDADLALCDAAFFDNEVSDTAPHLSAGQAARAACKAGVKKLVLTHIRPYTDEDALLLEAKKSFCDCVIAQEGESYSGI